MTKNNSEQLPTDKVGSVLVVGAGIGGMQAALDLADSGLLVHLISDESSIGGTMSRLDKTFPTGDCAMCMISPRMVESSRHPNIKLYTLSKVKNVSGKAGNFTVEVTQAPRYVSSEKCTGCAACEDACPVKVPNSFNQNQNKRKAIYALFPQAVPNTRVIDPENCLYLTRDVCKKCVKACDAEAIVFEDKEKTIELKVGAVILNPGLTTYDPRPNREYGFGKHQNVLTSLQYERLLSASGPCTGEVVRPSDKKHPKKIAWIQCAGSRNGHNGNNWCSSVCCMYAAKQSVITKEHDSEVDTTIFYMEQRTFGKDFDKFIERAKNDHGVRYIRSMVSEIIEDPETKDLFIHYVDEEGKNINEQYDMAVLSIGFEPHKNSQQMSSVFGVDQNDNGFIQTSRLSPTKTSSDGVFVSGIYEGPKDIPETVTQASGAAAQAMELLSDSRGSLVEEVNLPPEKDIDKQEARTGVFVCHCGINIAGVVDVEGVASEVLHEPGVSHTENIMYACAPDGQQRIKDIIEEKGLNRVVVASCTPRTHAGLFQDTIREAGLNKYLFELADIREQCSWCHQNDKEAATQKAIDIVKMTVAKARLLEPISTDSITIDPTALVIGGGIAGLTTSLSLANQGYKVELVEKEEKLGGLLLNVHKNLEGDEIGPFLQETIENVSSHSNITIHTNSEVVSSDGFVGNFTSTLSNGKELKHGATIIANGGKEYIPEEYGYGDLEEVITQRELEAELTDQSFVPNNNYVMIQCVGSRENPFNYCSRTCCQDALKNAIALKTKYPETEISILYRDIRSYGLKEKYYKQARDLGVHFFLFTPEKKPKIVESENGLSVLVYNNIMNKEFELYADSIVLSTGLRPSDEVEKLVKLFKLTCNDDGFFMEAHVKLRPVEFASEGLFLTGLAHSPKNIDETLNQAHAAAGRAGALLSHTSLAVSGIIANHNRDICMSCLACLKACPFGAPFLDEDGKISHNKAKCTGCGICAGVCPAKAFQVNNFKDDQILAMIDAVSHTNN